MAWLLSDYSGSDPCDLHRVIPCQPVEMEGGMEGLAGGITEEAGGATSPPLTLAAALASLGFADTGAFAVWAAAAEPDELEAMTEIVVSLTQP